MKAFIVVGTRPEAIKLAPVILRLRHDPRLEAHVVTTSQHRELLHGALAEFGIVPEHDLNLMQPGQSLAAFASRCLAALDPVIRAAAPDVVIAQGDTTSTFVAALVSFYNDIPFAHVEAGLRTGRIRDPFPEEFNRLATGRIADLHFAPTAQSRANLLRDGVAPEQVIVSGNTVIDALLAIRDRLPAVAARPSGLRRLLVTVHRRENFGTPLRRICDAISRILADHPDLSIDWPVHPNPAVHDYVRERFDGYPRVRLHAPLGYRAFVSAMVSADLILTDSGGVQEEAPALGRPVLVLREDTERPEAMDAGGALLVGTDTEAIVVAVKTLIANPAMFQAMATPRFPYGDGQAAGRIVEALVSRYKR
jgi:UDP-N-acetylglucosamine 2-epimerase (non-hydrolysing)